MQSTMEDEDALAPSVKMSLLFNDLICASLSIEDLEPLNLKNLHALLGNVALRTELGVSYPDVPTQKKILSISVILFNRLEDRFQNFFLDVSSTCAQRDTTFCSEEQYPGIDELTVLLRCCFALLPWLGFDRTLLIEKAKILLSILSRLISFDVNGKNGDHSTYAEDGFSTSVVEDFTASLCFLETPCPYRYSLCALLEVFGDELLAEGSSRQLLVFAESAVIPSERLFLCCADNYHIEIVLELMSARLFLLFSDKQASKNALDRLKKWYCQEEFRVPELNPRTALSLLLYPITQSAPKLFLGHLILLVSDAISTGVPPHLIGLTLMDCYLLLEKSVLLYKQHMSALHPGESFSGSSTNVNGPLFSSCIKQATRGKLDRIIAKSETLWDSCMRNMTLENTDMLSASKTFLKSDPYYLDKSCKDDILSVLIGLTTAAFSDDTGARNITSSHDIYLLSSILKLMGVSMFQFVRCFKRNAETLRSCKVYNNHLVVMLRCFEQFSVRLPVQSFLDGVMKDHPMRNKESSWMLLHFTGLLSLCFASRFDFLVKDCLSVMMALMNLIALEGGLSALRSLLEHKDKARKQRKKVATSFLRFRRRCLSKAASSDDDSTRMQEDDLMFSGEGNREADISSEKAIAKAFAQSYVEEDDLVDFVEINDGKDYFAWSKSRTMFKRKKLDKMADLKRKRRQRHGLRSIRKEPTLHLGYS